MAIAPFVIRWGPDAPSDMLRRSARCSKCGAKGATLMLPSASDLQYELQRLSGNDRQRLGPPLFGTVTGTRRPKGLSWGRF
jgi:hypothetical protein